GGDRTRLATAAVRRGEDATPPQESTTLAGPKSRRPREEPTDARGLHAALCHDREYPIRRLDGLRAVEIAIAAAVVQDEDRARLEALERPGRDPFGSGARWVEREDVSEHWPIPRRSCVLGLSRAEKSEWRPIERRGLDARVPDPSFALAQLPAPEPSRQERWREMEAVVQAHLVPLVADATRDLRVSAYATPHLEERGQGAVAMQHVEDEGRMAGTRTVVERDRKPVRYAFDPTQQMSERGHPGGRFHESLVNRPNQRAASSCPPPHDYECSITRAAWPSSPRTPC